MENTEKKGLLTKIQDYLDSPKGRILLNYLYSWGAAVVILGALFKLTHIKGANLMLFIGMGTEVLVFFISGFEKPFIPNQEADEEDDYEGTRVRGNIIINGTVGAPAQQTPVQTTAQAPVATDGASPLNIDGVENITQDYIARVHDLTLKMEQMCRHSERMEQSSEEIEQLSRNLISINTFYQMHLKSASTQMENIEKVNEQTRQMVDQIEELNRVYARMVEAMKVNSQMGAK
ncbi:MAG: gliding motility protein GldL [Bacteroidaceae bacterium]|nr:gliding motility protein GldL [Bacteroidaceae bacterium]